MNAGATYLSSKLPQKDCVAVSRRSCILWCLGKSEETKLIVYQSLFPLRWGFREIGRFDKQSQKRIDDSSGVLVDLWISLTFHYRGQPYEVVSTWNAV